MNHSLDRLLDGIVETLRADIIPKLEGEFVRGQAFGIVYALKSLKLRTSWSPMFLIEQLDALCDYRDRLTGITELPADAPRPELPAHYPHDPAKLEVLRDAGDAQISAMIVWLAARKAMMPQAAIAAVDDAIKSYIHRQLKYELKTSARPMFAEISLGKEQES